MTKNQKRIIAAIAIVFVAFCVISLALPFGKNGVFWLSYLFGVLAIAAQVYVVKIAFDGEEGVESKTYGFPIARVGIIYMSTQLVFSLIFMALADIVPIWITAILYVLILAVAAVGFIGTDAMREEIKRQEFKLETDTTCMMKLRSTTDSLLGKCRDAEAKKILSNLAETFRYSDPVSSSVLKNIETKLEAVVCELEEAVENGNLGEVNNLCGEVAEILEERNRLCKGSKRR